LRANLAKVRTNLRKVYQGERVEHRVLAFAGSPRRGGNSEKLLDSALAGGAAAAPGAAVTKIVLYEL
jgi:hypothetical protein